MIVFELKEYDSPKLSELGEFINESSLDFNFPGHPGYYYTKVTDSEDWTTMQEKAIEFLETNKVEIEKLQNYLVDFPKLDFQYRLGFNPESKVSGERFNPKLLKLAGLLDIEVTLWRTNYPDYSKLEPPK